MFYLNYPPLRSLALPHSGKYFIGPPLAEIEQYDSYYKRRVRLNVKSPQINAIRCESVSKKRRIYTVILCSLFWHYTIAQKTEILPDSIFTVLFNFNAIKNDTIKNSLIKSLTQFAQDKDFTKDHIVKKGETINRIIKNEYGIISEKFNGTYQKIEKLLLEVNDYSSNVIFPNQSIKVFEAPRINKAKNHNNLLQKFNLLDSSVSILQLDSFLISNTEIKVDQATSVDVNVVGYTVTPQDYKLLFANISDKVKDSLGGGAVLVQAGDGNITVSTSEHSDTGKINTFEPSPIDNEQIDLSKIDRKYFDTLVLIDYFDIATKCAHGNKVLGVINNIFNNNNVGFLSSNIKTVPINFYQNKKSAKIFLDTFYEDPVFSREEFFWVKNSIKKLIVNLANDTETAADCPKCIPGIYLDALMKYYYVKSPDIISTSFWVSSTQSPLPLYKMKYKTNLVTAAEDDDIYEYVESLAEEQFQGKPRLSEEIQPIKSYFTNAGKFGCIVVGCEKMPGEYYGMSSRDGSGVTTIGKGYNWYSNNKCLLPEDLGTSFATPEISAKLFLAKAYWRSLGLIGKNEINAENAVERLLLSSSINEKYVGKFASAGRISLTKLLQPDGFYVLDTSNRFIKIDSFVTGQIDFRDNFNSKRQNCPDGIHNWGITYHNNKFYLFNGEIYRRWFEIDLTKIDFTYYIKGHPYHISSKEDFINNISQLIVFKNQTQ